MSAPLNLAAQPFRNERLPTLIVSVCLVLLALLSARHALSAYELRAGGTGDVERQVMAMEAEARQLRAEAADLQRVSAEPKRIEEWAAVRDLVDRRLFSWTRLFSSLEQAVPPRVKLLSVTPQIRRGEVIIALHASGNSVEDVLALPKALAEAGFEDAFVEGYNEAAEAIEIHCTVRYVGRDSKGGGARS